MIDTIDLSLEGRCGACSQFVEDYGDKKAVYGHCGRKPRIGSVTNRDYKCDAYRLRPDFRRALEDAGETPTPPPGSSRGAVPPEPTRERPRPASEPPRPAPTAAADPGSGPRRVRVSADAPIAGQTPASGDVARLVAAALDDLLGLTEVRLGDRWAGGTMVLRPANPSLQEKEIDIDRFWRKIVMVREQLRNLERAVNSHPKLDDTDRVQLQQYITRSYGSLTTFNVLFKEKGDQFRGQKK